METQNFCPCLYQILPDFLRIISLHILQEIHNKAIINISTTMSLHYLDVKKAECSVRWKRLMSAFF